MLARLKLPCVLATLAAISAVFAMPRPTASQTRPTAPIHPGTLVIAHGPTAFGFLEFDWNGALPGFSPWQGDATTADLFPRHATE